MKVSVLIMTNTNEKTTTAAVVAKTEKATEKAVAKTEKAAAVKKAAKTEKVLTMSQIKNLARANGVTFVKCKNAAASYVIFDGKTSLHIKKSAYRMYATNADFELIKCLTLSNTELLENGNAVDKCRPHTVNIGNNADLKLILAAIAVNNHIELN